MIRISFVGDIAFNGGYEDLIRQTDGHRLAAAMKKLVGGSDLVVGNLEGPLTNHKPAGPPWRFGLHGHPLYANVLASAGITAVSLANNHAMDHGWPGLDETRRILIAAGIKHVGAGLNLSEARKLLRLAVNGAQIGMLAYCDVPTRSPLYAEGNHPGIAPLRRQYISEDIAEAVQACDLLIVCVHWGQEDVRSPAPRHRRLAREMISAGADIVVGHHPHVLHGSERIGRGAVAYSLGNFTFSDQEWHGKDRNGEDFWMPYRLSEENRRSAVWQVIIDRHVGIINEDLRPVYLGRDLLPVADTRPESWQVVKGSNAALKMRAYRFRWLVRMIRARASVIMRQICGKESLRKRLRRVRPQHMRQLASIVLREWEQFRGNEP